MQQEIITLNEKPALYRRDLRGGDLIYELMLILGRIKPGDTLRIHQHALGQAGDSLKNVLHPAFPHELWIDDRTNEFCVKRLG